ncbi:MAG: phosphatase PAP2 family protein [Candidatus Nanoarchaeia archaeon]|nr:phosphatase PAP2 family protein [Candidatus Nanoarchaeia archaeon]
MGYIASRNKKIFSALVAVLGSNLLVFIIKELVHRSRPMLDLVQTQLAFAAGYSYPSGHTATAFAAAVILSYCWPKYAKLFYPLAILVGLSRIYLGVHYPTDVIAGAIVGIISAITVLSLRKPVEMIEKKVNKYASSVF